ncbi:MAG TPA: HlyD family efflux transporter periplasmic adaptor subunit [Candidatus Paceibacterota bacterium]|nr:HlyD family efflux transporter periplasmic adaptor subunit [Candidatus Paceibacterota bacterium]
MKSLFNNPVILGALGIAALIAVGSAGYYVLESQAPTASSLPGTSTTSTSTITGTGIVTPAQNPDLAFETGGKVASVRVAVGDSVTRGETLASLDNSTLLAQRAQAAANLDAQEANLSQMAAGPRDVDVAAKQTAVSQAQLSLANLYATAYDTLSDAYGKTYGAVHIDTDTLFSNPDSINANLAFTTNSSQLAQNAIASRVAVTADLVQWQSELGALTSASSPAMLEAALAKAQAHLGVARAYTDTVAQVLSAAIPSTSFPQSSINASVAAVSALHDAVAARIAAISALSQQIASAKLAVQSAQDALNTVLAGSTPQEIQAQQAQVEAAQASVASIDAQIAKAVITAPFSGTVSSVHVKVGDIVAADSAAVSLTPQSALQINAYFSESDVASISVGQDADVTLDAYGSARIFPATVVSVDRSPTMQNGVPAYKVTLQFTQSDPAITSGMTANVTIK